MSKTTLLTVGAIKNAVEAGNTVYAGTKAYRVIKDSLGQWLIKCDLNGYCIGLTWRDGQTLNGNPGDFFIEREESK